MGTKKNPKADQFRKLSFIKEGKYKKLHLLSCWNAGALLPQPLQNPSLNQAVIQAPDLLSQWFSARFSSNSVFCSKSWITTKVTQCDAKIPRDKFNHWDTLITRLIMTAQICSHFCPTNSKDIQLLQSPESTGSMDCAEWSYGSLQNVGATPWGCSACAQISLRCLSGFWHPWELCCSIWNSSITPALNRRMGDPNWLIWRNWNKNYF